MAGWSEPGSGLLMISWIRWNDPTKKTITSIRGYIYIHMCKESTSELEYRYIHIHLYILYILYVIQYIYI